MNELHRTFELAASGMRAQVTRLRLVSENVANADTPGFRRKLTSFRTEFGVGQLEGKVVTGPVRLDQSTLPDVYDPAHPLSDGTGHYQGSNVDLMVEIADARQAQRSYQANLKLFDQARQMTSSLLDLLRR